VRWPESESGSTSTRRFEDRTRPPGMIGHHNRVNAPKIPQYHELMWPALQATKELGGSATVSEMNERAMASAPIVADIVDNRAYCRTRVLIWADGAGTALLSSRWSAWPAAPSAICCAGNVMNVTVRGGPGSPGSSRPATAPSTRSSAFQPNP
jgi:hypothetical protein